HDLNTSEGRTQLGLDPQVLGETRWVPLRVHDGDDASCLNLNRAQTPRLLGVDANQLSDRAQFLDLLRFLMEVNAGGPARMLELKRSAGGVVGPVPQKNNR
ncbi:MAG: hypothetical protein ABGZ17_28745, partial [Planctomycetaceae bacterium]